MFSECDSEGSTTDVAIAWLAVLHLSRDVSDWNLGPETGYADRAFMCFYSVRQWKVRDSISNWATTTSSSLLASNIIVRDFRILGTEASLILRYWITEQYSCRAHRANSIIMCFREIISLDRNPLSLTFEGIRGMNRYVSPSSGEDRREENFPNSFIAFLNTANTRSHIFI
jgi:hypothetical protein